MLFLITTTTNYLKNNAIRLYSMYGIILDNFISTQIKVKDKIKQFTLSIVQLFIKMKTSFLKNIKWFNTIGIMLIAFLLFTMFNQYMFNYKYGELQDKISSIQYQNTKLTNSLNYERTENRVKLSVIENRVAILHSTIKRIYPTYDYQAKVDEAITNPDEINDLPTELLNIYIDEYLIKDHGVKNYEKTLKDTIFPMEEKTSFVAVKDGEFGARRPYSTYAYRHEGLDMVNIYNNAVYAIYDMEVYDKAYEEGGGYTISVKFKYLDEDGNYTWYFARYRHLADINDFVRKGQKIKKGTIIATMSNTGVFATNDHCHIEIFKYNSDTDKWTCINFVKNSTWGNKILKKI